MLSKVALASIVVGLVSENGSATKWWPLIDEKSGQPIAYIAQAHDAAGSPGIVVAFQDVGDLSGGTCRFTTDYRAFISTTAGGPAGTVPAGSEALAVMSHAPDSVTPPKSPRPVKWFALFGRAALDKGRYVVLFRDGRSDHGSCQTAQAGAISPSALAELTKQ